jgi:hypothetical protein
MSIYRKIWKQHYGPIPKDENGRTYDIHHIDGNRNNNDISNLYTCSIQEHYDIHLRQEDWSACVLLAKRMNMSPELISELARKRELKKVHDKTHRLLGGDVQRKQVADGKNVLVGGEIQKKVQKELVESGKHHLLSGEIQRKNANKRVADGTHNLQSDRNPSHKRVTDGTHHLLGPEMNAKRIENGTHNFVGKVTCFDKKGSVIQVPKEVYQKQKEITKDQTQWEFVQVSSKEGKKRKNR